MAITSFSYAIIRSAFENDLLPTNGSILEFGEANWYGDVPLDALAQDIKTFATSQEHLARLGGLLNDAQKLETAPMVFALAKIFYGTFFGTETTTAIDFHGTEQCLQMNLNQPIDLDEQFDVTINNGTAEHIFNIGQFFSTMHDKTLPGGLMIHEGPMINGWVDHGFVNFQPTLFFDMAAANGYEILLFCIGALEPLAAHVFDNREDILKFAENEKLPDNTVFMTLLRKADTESDFVLPMQGFYSEGLSAEAQGAWKKLR